MYNCTGKRWLERTYSAIREDKVFFGTIAKPGMLGLDIVSKENFMAYSAQYIFLIIRLIPGIVVMVAIDKCIKIPIMGGRVGGYMELRETMYYPLCFLFVYLFACLFNNIFYISISTIYNV